eukprot:scaffold1841_cov35-Tisochrysis_lutea.AAC.6
MPVSRGSARRTAASVSRLNPSRPSSPKARWTSTVPMVPRGTVERPGRIPARRAFCKRRRARTGRSKGRATACPVELITGEPDDPPEVLEAQL